MREDERRTVVFCCLSPAGTHLLGIGVDFVSLLVCLLSLDEISGFCKRARVLSFISHPLASSYFSPVLLDALGVQ